MNTILIPQLDDLPKNSKVHSKFFEILGIKEKLEKSLADLNQLTKSVQTECHHPKKKIQIWAYDGNYRNYDGTYGTDVLKEKKCPICKTVECRPKGGPTKICHKCWGEMKFSDVIPGQGERFHCYECKKCGHEVQTT